MNYKISKKVMIPNLIISALLIITIVGLEGTNTIKKNVYAECPSMGMDCDIIIKENNYTLRPGENMTLNYYNKENVKIINYGVLISNTIALILNHIIYNRKYPIKQKLEKLLNSIEFNEK